MEEAYRRLMKRYHPDLPGGDADQAAEINRAYASLKGEAPPPLLPAVLENRTWLGRRGKRRGRLAGMLMLAAAVGALLLFPLPVERDGGRSEGSPERLTAGTGLPLPDTFDLRSLPNEEAIASAVSAAQEFHRHDLRREAAAFSRSCDDDLRTFPNPSLLDHCIAFDTASGMLGGASVNARFRAEDMAARHVGAALRVSDDAVLAEERVGIVRRKVEQMLVRREP